MASEVVIVERDDVVPANGQLWRHTKSGELYRVLDFCIMTGEVDQVGVAYYRQTAPPSVEFVRPLGGPGGWTTPNPDHTQRFVKVEEAPR